jgi:uncharacterized protein YjbI with pentapeptide repeats
VREQDRCFLSFGVYTGTGQSVNTVLGVEGGEILLTFKKKAPIEFRESFINETVKCFKGSRNNGSNLDFSNIQVTSIGSKVFYEDVSFYNVHFKKFEYKEVCFYNCSFTLCTFEEITTNIASKYQGIMFNAIFEKCGFSHCRFKNCSFVDSVFSKCKFNVGEFKSLVLRDVIFNLCSLSCIRFREGGVLEHTWFLFPSGFFDIRFEKSDKPYLIDSASGVSRFDYRDTRHLDNLQKKKIFRRNAYKDVAATLYSFKQLFAENHINKTSVDYYYLYKKADTRSSPKFMKRFTGYLAELIFGYGARPFNALFSLIIISGLYAPAYMLSGFSTGERVIDYSFNLSQLFIWNATKAKDLLESLYFSFFTLCTVGQGSGVPISGLTKIISSTELWLCKVNMKG